MDKSKKMIEQLITLTEGMGIDIQEVRRQALKICMELCEDEKGKPKEVTMHTVNKIFPCIAFYKAYINVTGDPKKAYAIIERYFTIKCKRVAGLLKAVCKASVIRKRVPKMMASVIHRVFGEKSGFEMIDREIRGSVCHIDMVKCPYHSQCQIHDCPELTRVFCDSDDVSYGNMHRDILWERTKTLGRGDDCCNFILKIEKRS